MCKFGSVSALFLVNLWMYSYKLWICDVTATAELDQLVPLLRAPWMCTAIELLTTKKVASLIKPFKKVVISQTLALCQHLFILFAFGGFLLCFLRQPIDLFHFVFLFVFFPLHGSFLPHLYTLAAVGRGIGFVQLTVGKNQSDSLSETPTKKNRSPPNKLTHISKPIM